MEPTCQGCNKPIHEGENLSTHDLLKGPWHTDCLINALMEDEDAFPVSFCISCGLLTNRARMDRGNPKWDTTIGWMCIPCQNKGYMDQEDLTPILRLLLI